MTEIATALAPLGLAQDWWFEVGLGDPVYTALDGGSLRSISLRGDLDEDALRSALALVVARHGAVRTRFVRRDGAVHQVVEPARDDLDVAVVDLRDEPAERRDALAASFLGRECDRAFDVEAGPLYRIFLVRLGDAYWVLTIHFHSLVFDGWSTSIWMRDLTEAYAAARGRPAELPELAEDYAAFAAWEQTQAERNLRYWRTELAGLQPTVLYPADRAAREYVAGLHFDRWDDGLVAAVRAAARALRTGGPTLLLAAYAAFLAGRAGRRDVAVLTLFGCRPRPGLEDVVGRFANALPLRLTLDSGASARDLVATMQRRVFDAVKHEHVSAAEVWRLARGAPMLAFFNYPRAGFAPEGLEVEPFAVERKDVRVALDDGATAPDDFDVLFREAGERTGVQIGYDAGRMSRGEIVSFAEAFRAFVADFVARARP